MAWQHIVGLMLVTGTGVLAFLLALMAWMRRPIPGAAALALFTLGVALWLIAYALELQSTILSWSIFWSKIEYIGIVSVPAGWFIFALDFTGHRRWLTYRVLGLIMLVPCITLTLVWTNAWHGLIWRTTQLNQQGPFSTLDVSHGAWFWIHTVCCYLYLFVGGFFLLSPRFRVRQLYRSQTVGLFVSAVTPWVGSVLYLSGVRPLGQLDLTPLAFTCSCIALFWTLLRFRLLEIVPIARDAVIDSMSDGVVVLDERACVVDLNSAARQIIGRADSEIIGQAAHEVLPAWPKARYLGQDTHTPQREVTINKGAAQRFFDLHTSPVHDQHNHVRGWLLVWHDISERKRTEVVLSTAKDAAESANRAKSTFLANMSHELRTPLTTILGYAHLLELELQQPQQPDTLTDLHAIQTAGQHLLDLINNVLDFSKIEAGKVDVQRSHFAISELVHNVELATRLMIEQHNNTLTVICDTHLGTMYSDRMKLHQILLNLLSNASKFTTNGAVTLSVYIEGAPIRSAAQAIHDTLGEAQPTLCFDVRDTGIGIAPAQLSRLFQPFIQAYENEQYPHAGTGLGLAISKHLCTLLDGEITVVSNPEQGSLFSVRLPHSIATPAIDAPALQVAA